MVICVCLFTLDVKFVGLGWLEVEVQLTHKLNLLGWFIFFSFVLNYVTVSSFVDRIVQ